MDINAYRKTITVTGNHALELSVIDVGPHQPPGRGTIVCIHGAGGQAEQWQRQIEHFAPHYRVIAPDLRGHGRSAVLRDAAYSLEEFLWDVTTMLTILKVEEPFVMMAHSFGGPIAITFAIAQPGRVSKLVLIATGAEMHAEPLHEFIVKLPIPLHYLERLRPILLPKFYAPILVIQRVLAGTLFRWRGDDILPRLMMPTLLIIGQRDNIAPLVEAERAARLIPSARLEVVRHSRHLPQIERPEAVNRLIDRFLGDPKSWREEDAL